MPRYYNLSEHHEVALRALRPFHAYSGQPLAVWQKSLRQVFHEHFGWDTKKPRVPLNIEELEREETETYVRRKLVFTSEPGADVPCHLLILKLAHTHAPAFICLQGHTSGMHISIGKPRSKEDEEEIKGDRDFALHAATGSTQKRAGRPCGT